MYALVFSPRRKPERFLFIHMSVPSSMHEYKTHTGMGWTGVTALLLLYTGLVTPAVIAFHWLDDACVIGIFFSLSSFLSSPYLSPCPPFAPFLPSLCHSFLSSLLSPPPPFLSCFLWSLLPLSTLKSFDTLRSRPFSLLLTYALFFKRNFLLIPSLRCSANIAHWCVHRLLFPCRHLDYDVHRRYGCK